MGVIKEIVNQLYIKTQIDFDEESVCEDLANSYSIFIKSNLEIKDKKMLEDIYYLGVINNAERIINSGTGRIDKKILKLVQADAEREIEKYKNETQNKNKIDKNDVYLNEFISPKSEMHEEYKEQIKKMFKEDYERAKKIVGKMFSTMSDEAREKTVLGMFDSLIKEIPEAEGIIKDISKCLFEEDGIKIKTNEFVKQLNICLETLSKEKAERIFREIEKNVDVKINVNSGKIELLVPENPVKNSAEVEKKGELSTEGVEQGEPHTTQILGGIEDRDDPRYYQLETGGESYEIKNDGYVIKDEGWTIYDSTSSNEYLELNQDGYIQFFKYGSELPEVDFGKSLNGNFGTEEEKLSVSLGTKKINYAPLTSAEIEQPFNLSTDSIEVSEIETIRAIEAKMKGVSKNESVAPKTEEIFVFGVTQPTMQSQIEEEKNRLEKLFPGLSSKYPVDQGKEGLPIRNMKKLYGQRGSLRETEESASTVGSLNGTKEERTDGDKTPTTPSDEEKE